MPSNDETSHEERIRDVSGVILAGGKSRRYGTNKALARADGVPLIERVTEVMKSIFDRVMVITNTPEQYSYLRLPMEEDIIKELGPLGGIHTALTVLPTNWAFVVGCDMPCLNPKLINYMIDTMDDFDVVVPKTADGFEILHCLYNKRCLSAITDLIDSGRYKVIEFFPEVAVHYIGEEEISRFDPDLRSFLNINTPGELEGFDRKGSK